TSPSRRPRTICAHGSRSPASGSRRTPPAARPKRSSARRRRSPGLAARHPPSPAAEAELPRSRGLAGIGETTIAIEHEINNPLSALLGHAELLLMERELTVGPRDELQLVREQAARIADVVRRLAKLKNPSSVEYSSGARMIDL